MQEQALDEFDPPMVECPLCGFRPLRIYDRDYRGITICRCRGCGLKLMNPQYTDAHLAAFYAQYITPDYPFGQEILAVALKRKLEILCAHRQVRSCGPAPFHRLRGWAGTEGRSRARLEGRRL